MGSSSLTRTQGSGHAAPADVRVALNLLSALLRDDPQNVRLRRQQTILDRYDRRGESRDAIARDLQISVRTLYLERRAALRRACSPPVTSNSPALAVDPSRSPAYVAPPLALTMMRSAEALYQVGALRLAADCLEAVAREAADSTTKVSSLGRLAEILTDVGALPRAEAAVTAAMRLLPEVATGARPAKREVLAGEVRLSLALRDLPRLDAALRELESEGDEAVDERGWLLRTRANTYASVGHYHILDLRHALERAERAAAALTRARGVPAFVRTHVLTTLAVMHAHDPRSVRQVADENRAAYALAVEHGMIAEACDALFNALSFTLYCDEPLGFPFGDASARAFLNDAVRETEPPADWMVVAIVKTMRGQFDDALALIDLESGHQDGAPVWPPAKKTLLARILYKAGRYREAERTARSAVRDWGRVCSGAEGAALRIRAEALEALGEQRAAAAVIRDAIASLEPRSPVHHLIGAYRCAFRLTQDPKCREGLEYLRGQLDTSAFRAPRRARLTRRERQVARLVGAGRTNPQIAAELAISPKTATNHVASILSRLDLRARWQVTPELLAEVAEGT
jgi:DNA-binding CsgD family transcriptional regulator/tetratricopeptide (TPR) repeat protein